MQQLILGTGTAIWWLTEPHSDWLVIYIWQSYLTIQFCGPGSYITSDCKVIYLFSSCKQFEDMVEIKDFKIVHVN